MPRISVRKVRMMEHEGTSVQEKLLHIFSAAACRMEKNLNEKNLSLLEYRELEIGILMLKSIGYRTARTKFWFTSPIQVFLDEKSADYQGQISVFESLRISRLGRFFHSALPMMQVIFTARGLKLPAPLEFLHVEFNRAEENLFSESTV